MNDIQSQLNKINEEQAKVCNRHCLYGICSMIATCWILLFPQNLPKNNNEHLLIIPMVVLMLAIIYFIIDTICHYHVASLARRLLKDVQEEEKDSLCVACLMTKKSNMTFAILKYKIIYCIILAILLGYHIVTNLI